MTVSEDADAQIAAADRHPGQLTPTMGKPPRNVMAAHCKHGPT